VLALLLGAAAIGSQGPAPHDETLPTAVRWSIALAGQPDAPPAIGDDRIYVALRPGIVAAHRLSDGRELWRRDLPTTTPMAVDDGRLFVASGSAIHALNADGSDAWQTVVGSVSAPLLAQDGWVIAAADGRLSALRASDGSTVWTQAVAGVSDQPSIEGATLYLPLADGRVVSLDLATGSVRWERRLYGTPTAVLPFADHVYVGSADKSLYCLDTGDGRVAWRQQIGAVVRGRPAADASRVYVVALDNLLRAFDRDNGALRWSPRGLPFRPITGPVVVGTTVVVAGTTDTILAFAVATGQPAGQVVLGESLATQPAYSGASGVTRIAAVTGSLKQEWRLTLAEPPLPSLAVEPLTDLPGLAIPIPQPPG